MSKPGVFITGATGFVGKRLTASLLEDGLSVWALLREDALDFDGRVQIVKGDVAEEFEIPPQVGTVFHCAGYWSDKESAAEKVRLERINVRGTERVVEAALAKSCRMIHLATATYAGETKNGNIDEDAICHPRSFYEETKYRAEMIVRQATAAGLKAQILRPTFIFGPGRKPADDPLLQLLIAIKRGRYRNIGKGDGIYNIIHVNEVVAALRALDDGNIPNGGVYFINSPITFRAVARVVVAATTGEAKEPRNIPFSVAYGIALLFAIVTTVTGRRMPLSISRLRTLTSRKVYSQGRLVDKTPYRTLQSVEEHLAQTCREYERGGLL